MEAVECTLGHASNRCQICDRAYTTDGLAPSTLLELSGGRCESCGKPEYAEKVRRNISPLLSRNQTNGPISRSLSPSMRTPKLDLESENAKLSEMLARLSVARSATNRLMEDMRNARRRSLDAKLSMDPNRGETLRIPLAKRLAMAKSEFANLENLKSASNQASTILGAQESASKLDKELSEAKKELRSIRTDNSIREKEINRMVTSPRDVGVIQDQLQRELAAIRARNANLRKTIELSRTMRQTKRDLLPSPRARVKLTLSPTHSGDTALEMSVPDHSEDPPVVEQSDPSQHADEYVVENKPETLSIDSIKSGNATVDNVVVAEVVIPKSPIDGKDPKSSPNAVTATSPAVSTSPPNLVPVSRELSRETPATHPVRESNCHWVVSDVVRMPSPLSARGDCDNSEEIKSPIEVPTTLSVLPSFIQQRGEFFDRSSIHWVGSPLGSNARLSPCEGDMPGSVYATPVSEDGCALALVAFSGPLPRIDECSSVVSSREVCCERQSSNPGDLATAHSSLGDPMTVSKVSSMISDELINTVSHPHSEDMEGISVCDPLKPPQPGCVDLPMDEVATQPVVLNNPEASETPSVQSVTLYNLPADALDILGALAIERGKTESICGGGIVCDVNEKVAVTNSVRTQPSHGDVPMDKVHDTPVTLPALFESADASKTPSVRSVTLYNLPADALDILGALAIEREKTESICGGGIVCDVNEKDALTTSLRTQPSHGDLPMDKVHDTPATLPALFESADASKTPSVQSVTLYNLPADALDILGALAIEREKTELIYGGGVVCDVQSKDLVSTETAQGSLGDDAISKAENDSPLAHPIKLDETSFNLRDTVIVDSVPISPINQVQESQIENTTVVGGPESTVIVSCQLCDTTMTAVDTVQKNHMSYYSYTGESVAETVFELSVLPMNETLREVIPASASITMCEGDIPEELESAEPLYSSTIREEIEEVDDNHHLESQMISMISIEEDVGTRNASLLAAAGTDQENQVPANTDSELVIPTIQNVSSLNDQESVELEQSSEFIPKQLFQSDVVNNEIVELGERSKDPTPSPIPQPAPIPVFMKPSQSPQFFRAGHTQ